MASELEQHLTDMENVILSYTTSGEQKRLWGRWFDEARRMARDDNTRTDAVNAVNSSFEQARRIPDSTEGG